MDNDNLAVWRAVETTDPDRTKTFSRAGGFKGTAIKPLYLIQRATELWGPMGGAWGITIQDEKYVPGAPITDEKGAVIGHDTVHVLRCRLFHPHGMIECFGQTLFCGVNKNGFFTDEEAPKKSLTDALTKGLSWLGFSADVHMGMHDDIKYVTELKERKAAVVKAAAAGEPQPKSEPAVAHEQPVNISEDAVLKALDTLADSTTTNTPVKSFTKAFEALPAAMQEAIKKHEKGKALDTLKVVAKKNNEIAKQKHIAANEGVQSEAA